MNQFIFYYYQFQPTKIKKEKDFYLIQYLDNIYYLYEVFDSKAVYKQYSMTKDIPFYDSFVFNKYCSIFSEFENHIYVLLNNNHIKYSSIFFCEESFSLHWYYSWINRSDYLENCYSQIRNWIPVIDDSFDYYLGLLEMSIYYLRDYSHYKGRGYLQHKQYSIELIHNPLNIIVDVRERDFAEYLKYIFWNSEYLSINLHNLIEQNKNIYDFHLVMARVLYPNYYFDRFDDIIIHKENSDILKNIVSRNEEFQGYVLSLFSEIERYIPIKKVSF